MTTQFYLYNKAFCYHTGITIEDIGNKIEELAILHELIRENSDHVYRHDSIYDEVFFEDIILVDIMHNPDNKILTSDQRKSLLKIVDHSKSCNITMNEVIMLLDKHDEDNFYGLLCLHKVDNVDKDYLIYNQNDWFSFHRHFLGLYPISEIYFTSECKKYFCQLFFPERIVESLKTLEKGLVGFSNNIIRNLTALNDNYNRYKIPNNRIDTLKRFSSACNVDVTPEGSADRKAEFTFEFINEANKLEKVCCEPHMKLSKSDDSGDTHHYNNRIYFHEGKPNIAGGKVLIGHVGKHL